MIKTDRYEINLLCFNGFSSVVKKHMIDVFSDVEDYRISSKEKNIERWVDKEISELPNNCLTKQKKYLFLQLDKVNVGYVQLYTDYKSPDFKKGFVTISLFMIRETYRRSYLGSKFLNLVEEYLTKQYSADMLRLAVEKNNKNGILFWEKSSFLNVERTSEQLIFQKPL